MKKIFLLAALAFIAMSMQAQVKAEVSETVELMSILSRTAGAQEYNMDMGGQYTKDTEAWFAPYSEHPTVGYYQGLIQQYGIGYNAPMDLAVNLVIDRQGLKFVGDKKFMDGRWANVDIDAFVTELNKFYTDTRFHEFFEQHQAFYAGELKRYNENVMKHFHQEWYAPFYGTNPNQLYSLIIGFTNGGGNYGASRQLPGKPKEMFSVCGYYVSPRTGKAFEDGVGSAMVLIHEFNHSFINHLYDDNKAMLDPIASKLFSFSENMMRNQAYPEPSIVYNETLVRAAVILYMQQQGYTPEQIDAEMSMNTSRGFIWMPEAVAALRDYANNRSKYPTLKDYYPKVAKALNNYADAEQKRFDKALNAKVKPMPVNEAASAKAEVMETVELMGILSHLAKYQEYYYNDKPETYLQDIEQWFEPFKQHPVIEYYQGLRQQYGIAYDAPMSLAVHLALKDGKIVKVNEQLAPGEKGLDSRWNYVDMNEFLGLLNQFYTDSRFHEFFVQHQPFYKEKLNVFNDNVMTHFQQGWFNDFLGKPSNNQFRVILGFANGTNGGYGAACSPQGQASELFAILGGYDADLSNPQYAEMNNSLAGMLVGMLSRASVAPLLEDMKKSVEMNGIGEKLYQSNKQALSNRGINDGAAVLSESLASAASIIYMMQNGADAQSLQWQLSNKTSTFAWMPELLPVLADYANNRGKYQSISGFYPQIAKALNKYLQAEQKRYDKALK